MSHAVEESRYLVGNKNKTATGLFEEALNFDKFYYTNPA